MDNPLVQPDPGLFIWTIITFLILLGLLAKFAWGPLLKALDERHATIRKSLDDADKAQQAKQDQKGADGPDEEPRIRLDQRIIHVTLLLFV
jgi:F-type H+-transporting ATPase subunit b